MSQPNGGSKHPNGTRPGSGQATNGDGEEKKLSCLQKFSETVMEFLEGGFSKLGYLIGSKPVPVMVIAVVISGLCGIGLIAFHEETRNEKLWVPDGADVLDHLDWIDENFPSNVIREQIIAVDDNVLDLASIKALLHIYKESKTLKTSGGDTFQQVCVSTPNCIVYSVLEVWNYNETIINGLTDKQILDDINNATISPAYGQPLEWGTYLGHVTRNPSGQIQSAKAAYMMWLTEGGDEMESRTKSWEKQFLDLGKDGHSDLSTTYVWTGRSWDDESGDAITGDITYLTFGYIIVIIFVVCVLGNYNFLEQRLWLTAGGFVCIGLSLLVSFGLSSAFQQDYGPLQSILPFLLLGIGVDDMFVILGALYNLSPEEQNCEIPELMAKVLGHAGVSITVTSLTDFVAFIVGATTIIPGLRSFCIYASMGILAVYMLQTTFFMACVAFDMKRIRSNRDACCFCVRHSDDYEPTKCSRKQFVPYVFKKALASIITNNVFRVVVIVITLALFGVNVWGFVELEQYFNPYWFIPDDSYAADFLEAQTKYFPSVGDLAHMYCGKLDYYGSEDKVHKLNELMEKTKYIANGTTDSWFEVFTDWLDTTTDPIVTAMLNTSTRYPTSLGAFQNLTCTLTTDIAPRTASYINFDGNCVIKATRMPFDHIDMNDAQTEIDAMDNAFDLVTQAGFKEGDCFPYTIQYLTWETNKIIQAELYRNLALAMACVFVVGLILIADVMTTLFVFLGVIFTLVDVAGTMHFWDLTIDTVTSVILILSIGLAVDYSAHIGHMFMRIKGTRNERAQETIREIGPPVFFGGFSTFLAFVLLANSNSYVFRTFFKVNFLVVLYGLYHGLIFLPVVLSLVGPAPYPNASVEPHNSSKRSNQVDGDKDGSGVDNQGFNHGKSRSNDSEMRNLSNMPTLEQPGQYQPHPKGQTSSSRVDLNDSSAQDGDITKKSADSDPNISVVRM